MKKLIQNILVASLAVFSLNAMATESTMVLEGKTFRGKTSGPQGIFDDDLNFKGGVLTSTTSTQLGFGPMAYKATLKGGTTSFKATVKNAEGDRLEWTGRIAGNIAVASATQTAKDGKKSQLKYTGKLKR